MKKKTTKLGKFKLRPPSVYTMFVAGVSMLLAAVIIMSANDMLGFVKPEGEVQIEIPQEAGLDQVATILNQAGVIKFPGFFKLYVSISGSNRQFTAGTFDLDTSLDYRAVVRKISRVSSVRQTTTVTFPEGVEIKQIRELLVEKSVCDPAKLDDALANHVFDYDFLKDKPMTANRLEGYLFPDTYEFYVNDDPVNVLDKMLANFDKKVTADMRAKAKDMDMTLDQIITLASIIEREAANDEERPTISSVFHNRLKSKTYNRLESCATVLYALGERKPIVTIADTQIDHPYNTYRNKGLPPGPIASPGISSIKAALAPIDTEYQFFALQADGTHKFSKTYEEHQSVPRVNP